MKRSMIVARLNISTVALQSTRLTKEEVHNVIKTVKKQMLTAGSRSVATPEVVLQRL